MALATKDACFFHMPRTGGNWVRRVLEAEFDTVELGPAHAAPGDVDVGERYTWTILRDPTEWLPSWFRLVASNPKWSDKMPEELMLSPCRFDSFGHLIDDLMARNLQPLRDAYARYVDVDAVHFSLNEALHDVYRLSSDADPINQTPDSLIEQFPVDWPSGSRKEIKDDFTRTFSSEACWPHVSK